MNETGYNRLVEEGEYSINDAPANLRQLLSEINAIDSITPIKIRSNSKNKNSVIIVDGDRNFILEKNWFGFKITSDSTQITVNKDKLLLALKSHGTTSFSDAFRFLSNM